MKEIPVLYGGDSGPDLAFVAKHNNLDIEEVIQLHARETYLVYVVGFVPGFAAMGTVPKKDPNAATSQSTHESRGRFCGHRGNANGNLRH